MNKALLGFAVGAVASTLLGGAAFAQKTEEVTVIGTRVVEKEVGREASGVRINEVSLSYGVSYAGLDLASAAGASELEKRVHEAASAACKETSHQRPLAHLTPDEPTCAKMAADKAMVKVHELVAAAGNKSVK
jgi:UrcA family protein